MSLILAPFDDEKQQLLKLVDNACKLQMQELKKGVTREKMLGKELTMDPETAGWVQIITAYGILYNRAIDAGWIKDVHLTQLPEEKENDDSVD